MQSTLDNWVNKSQISPVIIDIDIPNFADDWVSTSQSNPQIQSLHLVIAIADSFASGVAGFIANSFANSTALAVGTAKYSVSSGIAIANSAGIGTGSFVLHSLVFFNLNNWVSNSQLAPAFVKVASDYFEHWISNAQAEAALERLLDTAGPLIGRTPAIRPAIVVVVRTSGFSFPLLKYPTEIYRPEPLPAIDWPMPKRAPSETANSATAPDEKSFSSSLMRHYKDAPDRRRPYDR